MSQNGVRFTRGSFNAKNYTISFSVSYNGEIYEYTALAQGLGTRLKKVLCFLESDCDIGPCGGLVLKLERNTLHFEAFISEFGISDDRKDLIATQRKAVLATSVTKVP